MTIAFKGSRFERDVIQWGVLWGVVYPLSHRQIEEMCGSNSRRSLCASRPIRGSWRMDEI